MHLYVFCNNLRGELCLNNILLALYFTYHYVWVIRQGQKLFHFKIIVTITTIIKLNLHPKAIYSVYCISMPFKFNTNWLVDPKHKSIFALHQWILHCLSPVQDSLEVGAGGDSPSCPDFAQSLQCFQRRRAAPRRWCLQAAHQTWPASTPARETMQPVLT